MQEKGKPLFFSKKHPLLLNYNTDWCYLSIPYGVLAIMRVRKIMKENGGVQTHSGAS